MNKSLLMLTFAVAASLLASPAQAQSEKTNALPKTALTDDPEASYTRAIEQRTADILVLLELKDAAKTKNVHDTIVAQYRVLRAWHDTNDPALKILAKKAAAPDKDISAQAKEEIAKTEASLMEVHNKFISKLSEDLTTEQVEKVKDKMTYFKVKVTYDSYCEIVPTLTDEQKAKILEWLKEARELAMDAGSAEEKSAIFNKYKGRINNYLSKEGVNMREETKKWNERRKATAKPAEAEPAK